MKIEINDDQADKVVVESLMEFYSLIAFENAYMSPEDKQKLLKSIEAVLSEYMTLKDFEDWKEMVSIKETVILHKNCNEENNKEYAIVINHKDNGELDKDSVKVYTKAEFDQLQP